MTEEFTKVADKILGVGLIGAALGTTFKLATGAITATSLAASGGLVGIFGIPALIAFDAVALWGGYKLITEDVPGNWTLGGRGGGPL